MPVQNIDRSENLTSGKKHFTKTTTFQNFAEKISHLNQKGVSDRLGAFGFDYIHKKMYDLSVSQDERVQSENSNKRRYFPAKWWKENCRINNNTFLYISQL